jgi:hypothetical protein
MQNIQNSRPSTWPDLLSLLGFQNSVMCIHAILPRIGAVKTMPLSESAQSYVDFGDISVRTSELVPDLHHDPSISVKDQEAS